MGHHRLSTGTLTHTERTTNGRSVASNPSAFSSELTFWARSQVQSLLWLRVLRRRRRREPWRPNFKRFGCLFIQHSFFCRRPRARSASFGTCNSLHDRYAPRPSDHIASPDRGVRHPSRPGSHSGGGPSPPPARPHTPPRGHLPCASLRVRGPHAIQHGRRKGRRQ